MSEGIHFITDPNGRVPHWAFKDEAAAKRYMRSFGRATIAQQMQGIEPAPITYRLWTVKSGQWCDLGGSRKQKGTNVALRKYFTNQRNAQV
jgi:hypothetical protein